MVIHFVSAPSGPSLGLPTTSGKDEDGKGRNESGPHTGPEVVFQWKECKEEMIVFRDYDGVFTNYNDLQ